MSKTRNILASYKTVEHAQLAARELSENGFKDLQVDRVSQYPGSYLNNIVNPLTGDFDSLSNLTVGSFTDKNAEILAAADVAASGMADGSKMELDRNVLLTVVTDEVHAKKAEEIINNFGGII